MADPDRPSFGKGLLQRTLNKVLGVQKAQDIPEIVKGMPRRRAAEVFRREANVNLEDSLHAARMGYRTFPTAVTEVGAGAAASRAKGAEELIVAARRSAAQTLRPFREGDTAEERVEVAPVALPDMDNTGAYPAAVSDYELVPFGQFAPLGSAATEGFIADRQFERIQKAQEEKVKGMSLWDLLRSITK